ncbi:ZIP family metal transporter [Nocardia arizonensis]|uniref:ZIP family metal transporter n=1 Tax=Nocardia arizonensis TaxID=1141647 RepID=UPI0006D1CE41|nr:ZIP family metal transporter [Nocardia arizonensis]
MLKALLYGIGTAAPLIVGAAIGLRWSLSRQLLATLMAFGAGAMIAAVSTELFEPAFRVGGTDIAGLSLFLGAGVYVVANRAIETRLGPAAIGLALMLGTILDGAPENTALGVSLATESGMVLLVAVAVGNVPEAIGGAALMRRDHHFTRRRAFLLWTATGLVLIVVTVLGNGVSGYLSAVHIAIVQAFAGGATIAVLADSLMPEAYKEGGWWVGMATAAGFLTAFVIGA